MTSTLTPKDFARRIDVALLKADATRADIEKLCADAREFSFASVCVNGSRVAQAVHLLEETEVKVGCAVGFPLGANDADAKRYETEAAIDSDAQLIEVVMNLGRLKDGDDAFLIRELRDVVEAADERPVTVILETGLLTRDELVRGCGLAAEAGAKAVSTATGFGANAVKVEDVELLAEFAGSNLGVKAAGRIFETATALALLAAGATRVGTPVGPALVRGLGAAG